MAAPIDWQRLFGDLAHLGLTGKELARAAGVGTEAVKRWAGGTCPAGRNADRVVTVWCHMTGKPVEFVPRAPVGAVGLRSNVVPNLASDHEQEPATCQTEAMALVERQIRGWF